MPIFKVSKKAEDDLFEIGECTQNVWGIDQRNKYLDDIDKRFHQLASNPEYPASKDRSSLKKGCFSLLINEHIIIYRKFSYGVRIVRVLGQPMDIKQHL
jgi:toxin ParE1/3/4